MKELSCTHTKIAFSEICISVKVRLPLRHSSWWRKYRCLQYFLNLVNHAVARFNCIQSEKWSAKLSIKKLKVVFITISFLTSTSPSGISHRRLCFGQCSLPCQINSGPFSQILRLSVSLTSIPLDAMSAGFNFWFNVARLVWWGCIMSDTESVTNKGFETSWFIFDVT